jgi:hypothetical protein
MSEKTEKARRKEVTLPPPTEQQILSLAAMGERRFQEKHANITHWRDQRWRRSKVLFGAGGAGIPTAFKNVAVEQHTPEFQYQGQQAKALMMANDPVVSVRPPSKDAEPKATKVERFVNAADARLEEQTHSSEAGRDTQVHYGEALNKFFPRRNFWPDYPRKDKGEDAEDYTKRTEEWKKGQSLTAVFEDTHVPLDTCYYFTDPNGISGVIEVKNVNEWELMERYGLARTGDGEYTRSESGLPVTTSEAGREAKVIEYWNRQYRAQLVQGAKGGTMLDVWKHNFGRVPYFIAGAYRTGEAETALQHVPLLWALYAEGDENNRLHTMITAVAYMCGFPSYYIKMTETGSYVMDETTNQPKVFDIIPGKAPQVPPGGQLEIIGLVAGFDLQQAMRDSDERMKKYALPPIATGNAPSGDSAGWNTQMLRHFLVTLLDPLVTGWAQQLAERTRFMLWCIKNVVKETVYVNEELLTETKRKTGKREPICIGPDDILDYDVTVKIDPELEMNSIARESHGMTLMQGGGCSQMRFLTDYCRLDAPEEELFEIDVDAAVSALSEVQIPILTQWVQAAGATEQVLEGATPEQVMTDMAQTQAGLGKGSPMQPREPGVRMPSAIPMGESPTYSPETAGMGVPI